jgi:hypothetical protein
MRDILKVIKFEFLTVLRRRSFILSLILVPLIPSLLLGVLNLINQDGSLSFQEIFVQEVANPLPIGVVDMGNVIKEYPDWLHPRQTRAGGFRGRSTSEDRCWSVAGLLCDRT